MIPEKRKRIFLWQAGILILFLLLWEFSVRLGFVDRFFFSCPSDLLKLLLENISSTTYIHHILVTALETLVSFFLVSILSLSLAYFMWRSTFLAKVFEPYLIVLNSIPKSALTPLLIVWLGTGQKTIIVAGISVSLFGSILSFYNAYTSCEEEKQILIKTLGGTKTDCFRKAVFPSALPALITQSKVNIGLCLVGVIIGEFLAAREGLGYLIIYSSQIFVMKQVILSILILMLLAYILYKPLQILEKRKAGNPTG